MTSDASKKGWGASCQGITTGGPWSKEEKNLHINILELKAMKLALLNFTNRKNLQRVHIQMDKHGSSHLSFKNGRESQQGTIRSCKNRFGNTCDRNRS